MKKTILLVTCLSIITISIPYLYAYYFSVNYNVPFWYLSPNLKPLSIEPIRKMEINISPVAPQNLGEQIKVIIKDSYNNTYLEGVNITISKDGNILLEQQSNKSGEINFEYPGTVTILKFEKDGYETEMKVIPRVPENWVMTRNNNNITTFTSVGTMFIMIVGIVLSQRKDLVKSMGKNNKYKKK